MSVGPSSVCSWNGSATFSASVMELQRAPFWYSTPVRRSWAARSSSSMSQRGRPSSRTVPSDGRSSPIRCFSSVLLPEPLPPMITKISPCSTSKVRSRITTNDPKASVRSSTEMVGAEEGGMRTEAAAK